MNINKLPYLNYPNPRLRRKNYQILNGIWDFAFIEKMEIPESFDKKIKVPFTYETEYSLINQQELIAENLKLTKPIIFFILKASIIRQKFLSIEKKSIVIAELILLLLFLFL